MLEGETFKIPAFRPVLICVAVAAALFVAGYATAFMRSERTLDAAKQAEEVAMEKAQESGRVADGWRAEADALRGKLAGLPKDPGHRPVPSNASAPVVVRGLVGLGVNPVPDRADVNLTLKDGRTVLGWGYEAQRVGPLVARLETTTALAEAQERENDALRDRGDHLESAVKAADAQVEALIRMQDRRWSAGLLMNLDLSGRRRFGGYASRNIGRIQALAVVEQDRASIGAGWRW